MSGLISKCVMFVTVFLFSFSKINRYLFSKWKTHVITSPWEVLISHLCSSGAVAQHLLNLKHDRLAEKIVGKWKKDLLWVKKLFGCFYNTSLSLTANYNIEIKVIVNMLLSLRCAKHKKVEHAMTVISFLILLFASCCLSLSSSSS